MCSKLKFTVPSITLAIIADNFAVALLQSQLQSQA